MQNTVFKICLCECCVYFVNFCYLYEFWDDSMLSKLSLSHLSCYLFSDIFRWGPKFVFSYRIKIRTSLIKISLSTISLSNILVLWTIHSELLTTLITFLMNEWEANIIFKFSDSEIDLKWIFKSFIIIDLI